MLSKHMLCVRLSYRHTHGQKQEVCPPVTQAPACACVCRGIDNKENEWQYYGVHLGVLIGVE